MKQLIFLFFIGTFALSYGQRTLFKNYQSDYLKDIRDLSIYLPKGYEKDSISNFPLTIILDGQNLFDVYVGTSNYFSATDNAPEQIIVGIDMGKTRKRDTSVDATDSKLTPESKKFYQFIKGELLPYLEANYKTSPFLTLVGSGASANFVNYFLKEKTPIFNAYVCLNPTLPPDASKLIIDYNLKRLAAIDNTYYYYLSSSPFNAGDRTSKIENLNRTLSNVGAKNFNVKYDEFRSAPTSVSAVAESIPRAFSTIFEIYSGISKEEYEKKVKNLDPPSAIAYLETKYLDIEYLFGTNLGIRERDIIAIEDIIIEKENGDYLKDFAKMILKVFPQSQMGHYYMGRYHETGKDYMKALEQYRIGYGKMDPSDPNADKFYQIIERILRLL